MGQCCRLCIAVLQSLHHTLHAHEARTFDQHRTHLRQQFKRLGLNVFDAVAMHCVLTSAGSVFTQFTQGQHMLNAVSLCISARFGMKARSLHSHLGHVAEYQQARRYRLREYINGSVHRIGVGVVAVVDQTNGMVTPCATC